MARYVSLREAVVLLSLTVHQGHPCAEDCGSTPGWENLKASFKKRGDADGQKAWYKQVCANGDPKGLDPYKWDISDVNDELAKIK